MCGRYSLFARRGVIEERFDVTVPDDIEPTYNAAPGQHLPVVTDETPETVVRQEWGFVPEWADDGFSAQINARAETADEKPAFRDAYRSRRCVVLADGFYEWAEADGEKRPHRVEFADRRPFAMAGLWARRTPETTQAGLGDFGAGADGPSEDDPEETFAVLTTEPNEQVADLHDRMPVLLDPADARSWLGDPDPGLLRPYPGDDLQVYAVSSRVNSPANDDPGLVEPVEG